MTKVLTTTQINQLTMNKIVNDQAVRRALASRSHYWFFNIYLSHYVKSETADFQKQMFALTEDQSNKMAVVVAFRGSAKSTIMTLSYPLWAILGEQQKKFVLIASQTQSQVRQHLKNIKDELERNTLLRRDLGPFKEEEDEWNSYSLVIPKYNARITSISTEQGMRGIRHGENRPDLIICDDVEDSNSVKTRDGRNKTYNWLLGDIIPSGDTNTKTIIVGSLLHEDSLLMRLKEQIEQNTRDGVYKHYPLLDQNDQSIWPGKYPTAEDVEILKRKVGDDVAWQREYLLRIIADNNQVVHREWLHFYDQLPDKKERTLWYTITGVDLAISETDSADYTAMVSARVYEPVTTEHKKIIYIYILPNPVNKKMSFPKTLEMAKETSRSVGYGNPTELLIEDIGYQRALIQQLQDEGYPTEGFKHSGQDKRSRLALTTNMIKEGFVLFPKTGAEELINQIVNFGVEKHDDLADAFVMTVLESMKRNVAPRMIWDFIHI